jgi:hypothetical protein
MAPLSPVSMHLSEGSDTGNGIYTPTVVPVACNWNFSPDCWMSRSTSAICCEYELLWVPI